MISIIIGLIGLAIGYFYRDLRDSIKELQNRLPKEQPDIGATPASYGPIKGYANQDKEIGLVEPKTPEQMAWEASERLRQQQYIVEVKNGNANKR